MHTHTRRDDDGASSIRTGAVEAKTTLAGDGLPAEDVTLAELLRDAGYATSHICKWLLGETHGRRDYVFVYEGDALKSVVKNKYKMHLASPGQNPIIAAQNTLCQRASQFSRLLQGSTNPSCCSEAVVMR